MKLVQLLLSSVLLAATVTRAAAQDIGPALDPTLMAGWAGGEAVRYDLEKRAAAAKGTRTTSATSAARSFTYQSSPAMRKQTVERLVSSMRASSPGGARAVEAAFGPGKADYETTYASLISGTGLRSTDAADAMTCYLMVGYAIVNNVQDDKAITPAMVRGLRGQVASILLKNPNMKPGDPLAAARLGEQFKLQAVILQGGWQAALKQNTLPAYRNIIGQLFQRTYGMDLSQYRLTTQGFAKR